MSAVHQKVSNEKIKDYCVDNDLGGSDHRPISVCAGICLDGLSTIMKTLVRIAILLAELWNRDFPNTKEWRLLEAEVR